LCEDDTRRNTKRNLRGISKTWVTLHRGKSDSADMTSEGKEKSEEKEETEQVQATD